MDAEFKKQWPELANRKGIMFHHDNVKPHVYFTTRRKMLELGWLLTGHPTYSPDLASSDYHLFWSLQNSSSEKDFVHDDELKCHVTQFFYDKTRS